MKPEPYVVFVVPGDGFKSAALAHCWFLMVPGNIKSNHLETRELIQQFDLTRPARQQAQFENHT